MEIRAEHLFVNEPDLLSLGRAAELVGVGRTKKYELASILKTVKVGKEMRVFKRDLAEYVVENVSKGKRDKAATPQKRNEKGDGKC